MHKNQPILMWLGIIVLVGFCLLAWVYQSGSMDIGDLIWFLSVVFIIVSITAGLVASAAKKQR